MLTFNNYLKNREWLNLKQSNVYYLDGKEYKILHIDGFPVLKQSLLRQELDLKKISKQLELSDYSGIIEKLDNKDYGLQALKNAISEVEKLLNVTQLEVTDLLNE